MKKQKSSLEEYLGRYVENSKARSYATDFASYKRGLGIGITDAFTKAIEGAYTSKKRALSGYGKNAEALLSSGLTRSGYREHLDKIAGSDYRSTLGRLYGKRNEEELSATSSYTSYLDDLVKKHEALVNSVSSKLVGDGIIDRKTAYDYAISKGLTKTEAEDVSNSVYNVMRKKIMNKIIDQIAVYKLDAAGAMLLAKNYGLSDEDARNIANEAKTYLDNYRDYADKYLDYLIDQADKSTVTY